MGGASQATKDQQQVNLSSSQQELAFQKQLTTLFQQQFASQKGVLDFLQNTLKPQIEKGGEGFAPDALAAMRTSATDTTSQQFQNAQAALNQQLKTSGSSNVPSGVTVGADAALAAEAAKAQASGQNTITLQNEQQRQSNYWNSIDALNGVASQQDPLGYSSAASGAGGTVAGLSSAQGSLQNAITNANSNSFFGKLGGSFASALGSGLGGALTGGLGTAASKIGDGSFGW